MLEHLTSKRTAATMAAIAIATGAAGQAKAQPESVATGTNIEVISGPEFTASDQFIEQNLLDQRVPQPAQDFINRNTAYLNNGMNCSGAIIRNPKGVAVGVSTASHCGLRNSDELSNNAEYFTPWITGRNGATYILKGGGVGVETGSNMKDLKSAGNITQFILPPKGNVDMDQALGVLPGHTAQEVLDSYKKEQLSQKEIDGFIPGKTTIWMAGWPFVQNGDGYGNKIRQQFAMTYIGQETFTTQAGETIRLVLASVHRDKNGAVCSGGASGSQGFVLQKQTENGSRPSTRVRSVGPLSLAWPLTGNGDPQLLNQYAEYFKTKYPQMQWQGIDAVCGFAIKSFNKDYAVVNVASDLNAIPNPQVTSTLIAETLFYSPEYIPTIINGFLVESLTNDTNVGTTAGKTVIEKPVIFTNDDGSVVIGHYEKGGLAIQIYPDPSQLQFYAYDPTAPPGIIKTKSVNNDDPSITDTQNLGSFEDSTGLKFGIFDTGPLVISGQAYKISIVNGQIKFIPSSG